MRIRDGARAGVQAVTVAALVSTLAACGGGDASAPRSLNAAPSSGPTSSGSSESGLDVATARRRVQGGIRAALRNAGTGQEYICLAGQCQLWNVSWSQGGRIYDVAYPAQKAGQPGIELRHEPDRVLERAAGSDGCWWPADPTSRAHFSRPVLPQVLMLRSAKVTGLSYGVAHGTVAAQPLMEMLGSDAELRQQGLIAPASLRARADFSVRAPAPNVTVDMQKTLRSLHAAPKRGSWKWEINYGALPTGLPAIPPSQIVEVSRSDPSWSTAMHSCTARLH